MIQLRDEKGQAEAAMVVLVIVLLVLLVAGFFGLGFLWKGYSRYQKRADAENQVKVTEIQIRNQEQRVKIANQKAEIRYVEATGIRRAQDQISGTLTPLYVQHEMIQAMSESGAATIYIPTDPASGLPVVTTRNAGGR
jgi:hypothetical protein